MGGIRIPYNPYIVHVQAKDRDNAGITAGINVTLENEKFTWGNYCPIFCLLLDRVHLILIIRLGHSV